MGVVQRQAFKASIINMVGIVLGMINVIYVVPYAMELYGVYAFISSVVGMTAPLISLGMLTGGVRFFHQFDDGTRSNRTILPLGLVSIAIGFLVFIMIVYLAKDQLITYYKAREPFNYRFLVLVIPMTILTAVFSYLTNYVSNFHRIVVPAIVKNLTKIFLPCILILYAGGWIDMWGALIGLVLVNLLLIIFLLIYIKYLGEWDWRWDKTMFNTERIGEMRQFVLFGWLLSLGSVVTSYIDAIMVGSMIDMGRSTAIYSIGTVISTIMIMPNTVVAAITSPIISALWRDNDTMGIQEVYTKSSKNLTILGILFFLGVWLSVEDVFKLMHNGEEIASVKNVILFLGLARLFSMMCGVNGMVLNLSPSYRYSTYFILVLAVINVFTNYFFINKYGLVGAAIGTAISVSCFNMMISSFLFFKYRLIPFGKYLIPLLLIAGAVYLLITFIVISNPYLAIVVKSVSITVLFVSPIYLLKISEEFNKLVRENLLKVASIFK